MSNKGKECRAIAWWKKVCQVCIAWMNKHRITMVITLTIFSVLVCVMLFIWPCQLLEKIKANIHAPIFVFTISVFPSFYFWVIRNKDRLDAIKEQQESNKEAKQSNENAQKSIQKAQEANDYTSFSHALTLFAAKEIETKAIGLKLLIQIRNKLNSPFTEDIDLITKYAELDKANLAGANLQKANLEGACLYSANLEGANLYGANLCSVNLCSANLQDANLHGAKLQLTRLQSADLQGANLQSAQNLLEADWGLAQNVEQAIFNNEETKQAVLKST